MRTPPLLITQTADQAAIATMGGVSKTRDRIFSKEEKNQGSDRSRVVLPGLCSLSRGYSQGKLHIYTSSV